MTPIPDPTGFLAFFTPSSQEILIIVFLAFLLFGAKKIPELMRSLGRAQGEFQHARKAFDAEVSGSGADKAPAKVSEGGAAREGTEASAAVRAEGGTTTTTTDDAELAGARAEAEALGIDTEGKDLATLRQEIAAKRAA